MKRILALTIKIKLLALWGGAIGILMLNACATTELHTVPVVVSPPEPVSTVAVAANSRPAGLTVMTLNIAHARRDGLHQMLQSAETAVVNLEAIADVLRRHDPDIVALQEADGPSFWSGNFNHVEHLASYDAPSHYVRGEHVRGPLLSYGTALLSDLELRDPLSITFDPSLSPLSKGFLVSSIRWPDPPFTEIDVVSVHLDPFSPSVRREQAMQMVQTLRKRARPLIMMGDFNTDWQGEGSALRMLAEELDLKVFQPGNVELETFPALGKRLDWILVSPQFEFAAYRVLPDRVSDHLGVIAELRLAKGPNRRSLTRGL